MSQNKPSEILVVDAELKILQLMCNDLRSGGYKVVPTSGYVAAVNTFRFHSGGFALLVTAVSLPEKNGCELARILLGLQPDLKVLFVSATSGAEICRYHGLPGPGLHFLEKPFKRAEFLTFVRLILENGEVHPLASGGVRPSLTDMATIPDGYGGSGT